MPLMFGKFNLNGVLWTVFFMALGFFLMFIGPSIMRRRIDEGIDPPELENVIRCLRIAGAILLFYCIGEIVWMLLPHAPKAR